MRQTINSDINYYGKIAKQGQSAFFKLSPFYFLLFFLFLRADEKDKDKDAPKVGKSDITFLNANITTVSQWEKCEDPKEEEIDFEEEERESATLDVAEFRSSLIIDEPINVVELSEDSLTISTLPYFFINDKEYIPLHQLQYLLNLREVEES